jgi:hypothetical protein
MMFPARATAALAAVAMALPLAAAPLASARTAHTTAAAPVVRTTHVATVHKTHAKPRAASLTVPPGSLICTLLIAQLRFATGIGNTILVNLLGRTLQILGCGGAAI